MPWARRAAPLAATFWLKSKRVCDGCAPTTSTFTRFIIPIPKRRSKKHCARFDDLVKHGKVRYIGCSNFSAAQLKEAETTAKEHQLHPFVSSQDEYSLLVRDIEGELLPLIEKYGMSELPYFPLASGMLTGKHKRGQPAAKGTRLGESSSWPIAISTKRIMRKSSAWSNSLKSAVTLCWSWLSVGCCRVPQSQA